MFSLCYRGQANGVREWGVCVEGYCLGSAIQSSGPSVSIPWSVSDWVLWNWDIFVTDYLLDFLEVCWERRKSWKVIMAQKTRISCKCVADSLRILLLSRAFWSRINVNWYLTSSICWYIFSPRSTYLNNKHRYIIYNCYLCAYRHSGQDLLVFVCKHGIQHLPLNPDSTVERERERERAVVVECAREWMKTESSTSENEAVN